MTPNIAVPPEWAPHDAMWVGFPSHPDLWGAAYEAAQREVADLVRALAIDGGETVRLLVAGEAARRTAEALVGDLPGVHVTPCRFGDIWLRDVGPIFARRGGQIEALSFRVNGWGGKHHLPEDFAVANRVANLAGVKLHAHPFVLEGGALDYDGEGLVIATRQCLLNPNRNGWRQREAEAALALALGARQVLWLDMGLEGDETDGHVDNLARMLGPDVVACPVGAAGDPNAAIYDQAYETLQVAADLTGRDLNVLRPPAPGPVRLADGRLAPASHMNFIIANAAVIVPRFRGAEAAAEAALEVLAPAFPGRRLLSLPSDAILTRGGSFHCISQQQPRA